MLLGAGDSLLLDWMFSLVADLRACREEHAESHNQAWLHVKGPTECTDLLLVLQTP